MSDPISGYTPQTENIRLGYSYRPNLPEYEYHYPPPLMAEFDRWLEAHDQEVAAKAKAGLLREITLVVSTRGGTDVSIVNRILEILDETL